MPWTAEELEEMRRADEEIELGQEGAKKSPYR